MVYEDSSVLNIVHNTTNTWEPDRNFDGLPNNTVQGKIVEDMFESYVKAKDEGIEYSSYDIFRTDNYRRHASIDGILDQKGNVYVNEGINKITQDVNTNNYGKISDETFEWLANHKVYTVEIKSSKMPDKDYPTKINKDFNSWDYQNEIINNLREKDFFVYPKYDRENGYKIHNFNDYVEHAKEMGLYFQGNFVTDLLNSEKRSKCDIYTRIFIDKSHPKNLIAYILGYILKEKFFENPKIINMPGGKSGRAIYYAYPISKSNSIDELLIDRNLW